MDRDLTIHTAKHSFGVDDNEQAVAAFLDWFRQSGPDDVFELKVPRNRSILVQKRNITHVEVE